MSKKTELAKNTLILAVGRLSSQFVSFLLLPLYTVYLTPEQYGLVDLIVTYVTLMVPIVLLQLDRGAFRYLIDARGDYKAEAGIIYASFKTVSRVVILASALYLLVTLLLRVPHYSLIAAMVISAAFSSLLLQIARGLGHNKYFAKASIIAGVTLLTTALFLVVGLRWGVAGVLLAAVVSNSLSALYLVWRLRVFDYLKIADGEPLYSGDMLRYSLPLIPSNISWWAINVADRTIITIFLGIAANGIYAVANKYASIFSAVYAIFDMSWTESASMHINSKDRDKFFSDIHNTSLRLFGALGLMMVAGMPLFFNILVGAEFRESYNYYPILVLAALVGAITAQYSAIYIAKKLTGKIFITSTLAAAINIALNVIFIRYYGLYAAAISTVIAYFVMGVFRAYDTKKYVTIRYEKVLTVVLVLLYIFTFVLYYANNSVLNVVNILIITGAALFLNRNLAKRSLAKILVKVKLA